MPGSTATGSLGRALDRYRHAPIGARLFIHGRAFLSDLAVVERYVPNKGFIVDLGCGHGLFACVLREASPTRRVLGIDLDPRKIDVARGAIQDTQWLRFEVGDIVADVPPRCDAVALGEGGPLVVKAQERRLDPRYALTYGQELITVSVGFTQGGHERFFFPSRD